ncbi:hypothetical protein L5515_019557 [Caenorhabditis briggsae]|uniref:F-box domain-containing protein n=2 Tax=Caenorhabditis briggsae TaxID=6238 RepID=A0AAE9FPP9_CAEBR|nr:hypothetical protein L5515_019557 [Caenorhabditis briggsae]
MNGPKFPLHRLPKDLCSEVIRTMDLYEIINYSFLSKKATSMVTALQLPILYVDMTMEEQPVMLLQFEGTSIEFTLELQRNNKNITNLYDFPIRVKVKHSSETREFESTISNQQMDLVEWIRHFSLFDENLGIDFHVGDTHFDIPTVRNTLPKLRDISITFSKDEPDESDIINAQNLLRALLSKIRCLDLLSVPLQENLYLQHIGIANLEVLYLEYQSNVRFVDLCSWNVEKCIIAKKGDQMSLVDLNRFFKLWIKGSNPKLNELFIEWETEIIPDWNVLLKGLKIEKEIEDQEEEAKYFTIRNSRDICAEIKVCHSEDTASVEMNCPNPVN